ncbi:MAG: VWA domain-containing protein [Pseudomonadota bacterium]|nr:VWA domain-containing protein [Pseudomonadota bacterium]
MSDVLPGSSSPASPARGKLAGNIMHFARVLRQAGLPVGSGQILDALEAVRCGPLAAREDFYWALNAVFVKRREHQPLFDQAFHIFWRKPKMIEQLMQLLFQQITAPAKEKNKQAGYRRLAQALFDDSRSMQSRRERPPGELELEASITYSSEEVLRRKDFEQMTVAEQAEARRAIAKLRGSRIEVRTRRFRPAATDRRVDLRRTLSRSVRSGGDLIHLSFRARSRREPPLVVLCDISGSMSNYSRMFLHFLHALMNDRRGVQVFLFGTRLTNVTRELARRDVDDALAKVSDAVKDWSGGTRIGSAIKEFNYRWARRVLAQGAHVLLMSDGLDRGDTRELSHEMARLARTARRIIWLNPLLRFAGFEARAEGVRAIMPHVDEFRPVHSLESLENLARSLAYSLRAEHDARRWAADMRAA